MILIRCALQAQALLRWHQTSRFCSVTGQPTCRNQAGSQRVCSSKGIIHYPKVRWFLAVSSLVSMFCGVFNWFLTGVWLFSQWFLAVLLQISLVCWFLDDFLLVWLVSPADVSSGNRASVGWEALFVGPSVVLSSGNVQRSGWLLWHGSDLPVDHVCSPGFTCVSLLDLPLCLVVPGESLEEALCREVAEEVGLEVQSISYSSSQHWPFPHSSFMMGCHASVSPAHTQVSWDTLPQTWFWPLQLYQHECYQQQTALYLLSDGKFSLQDNWLTTI